VFGPATKRAVRAFQRAHGLTIDAIVGPATLAALGVTSTGTSTSASTTAASTRAATPSAALPAVPGALAKSVQRALGITADGVFGPLSRAALRSYQGAHGLAADGVPGPQTLAALGLTSATARSAPTSTAGTTTVASGTTAASGTTTSAGVSAAVAAARTKIGSPYASGGNGPSSFDCSGLTSWAMRQAGIDLPRTSYAQYGVGTAVSHGSVQAGDLVFFTTDGPGASHVGIATGPSTAISATSHGVMEHSTTSGYWGDHYLGARRVA
jgi:cell wall-associated NlpC family hydrolase